MVVESSKLSPADLGINAQEAESEAENELNEYGQQMEEALGDLMVKLSEQHSQPADIKTAMKESLVISRMFDMVITDHAGHVDVDTLQKAIDEKVAMLGLQPDKFSLHKLQELIKQAEK
jgi:hypothetical protein